MAAKAFNPKNPMDWARTLPGASTAMGILDEGIGLGDFATTMAKNLAVAPVAGVAGIVDLLRNRDVKSASDTIERVQSKAGGPQTEVGGKYFDAMENVISLGDPVWNTVGKGLDKLATANQFELPNGQRGEFTLPGEINPGAALSSGIFAVGQLAGPGKGKKVSLQRMKKDGIPISNMEDATARFSNGEKIYGFHEQGGEPMLIESIEQLNNHTPDLLLALPDAAPKPSKGPKKAAVGTVFDNVTDYVKAMQMALRSEHLKRTPEGKYVGAPADVDSPQKLARNRRNADRQVENGVFNADWYTRARNAAVEASGDNPLMQSLFARGTAGYSPQAMPNVELNAFLRQHNSKQLFGEDVVPRTGSQSRNIANAYSPDAYGGYILYPERIRLGRKTGPYADAKNPTIPDSELFKTANDIWHGRVMGYGDNFSRGFTPQEHGFLTGENLLLANRAEQRGLGAGELAPGFEWNPRSSQAATWGATRYDKYLSEAEAARSKAIKHNEKVDRQRARGVKGSRKMTVPQINEEALRERASFGIDSAIPAHVANDNFEFVTGENVGHLKGLNREPEAVRGAYSRDMANAYFQPGADGRLRDPFYESFGMYQRDAVPALGRFTNSAGVVETNPAFSSRPLVSLRPSDLGRTASGNKRSGGLMMVDDAPAVRQAALLRALLTGQEGGGWNKFTHANSSMKGYEKTGARLTSGSPEDLAALENSLAARGLDTVHVGDAVHAGRFYGDLSGAEVQDAVKQALRDNPTARGKAVAGRWQTGYEGVPWTDQQGTGQATRAVLNQLETPEYAVRDAAKRLDAGKLRGSMDAMNEIDRALSSARGLPMREDLMKLREMIRDVGLQGVIEYVKKNGGVGLPALALVPTLAGLASQKQAQPEG